MLMASSTRLLDGRKEMWRIGHPHSALEQLSKVNLKWCDMQPSHAFPPCFPFQQLAGGNTLQVAVLLTAAKSVGKAAWMSEISRNVRLHFLYRASLFTRRMLTTVMKRLCTKAHDPMIWWNATYRCWVTQLCQQSSSIKNGSLVPSSFSTSFNHQAIT